MREQNTEQLRTILLAAPTVTGHRLGPQEVEQLIQYYALVLKWTPQLHLTTVLEPQDFFQRHIFEAAFLTRRLVPSITEVWDLGSGLGVPGIPLAILRPELNVYLVEANHRKAIFLEEVSFAAQLKNLKVLNRRFESLAPLSGSAALAVRAMEKMASLLPMLLELGKNCSQLLLLGGPSLVAELNRLSLAFDLETVLLPGSQQRLLIDLTRST